MTDKPTVLFVVGPTACGKSEVAVEIAEKVSAQIINTDSVQFFAGVDIGAAKPGPDLLRRVPHHLVGHMPVGSTYTAGLFREDALALIGETQSSAEKGAWVAVGGSGFYVQALEKGMFDVPEVSLETKMQLESDSAQPGGWSVLYGELGARDPQAAAKIKSADRYRILRALEILRSHPGTLTEIRENFNRAGQIEQPFETRKIGLVRSRENIRARVEERTRQMLKRGLIEEVQGLRAELSRKAADGSLDNWAPLRAVGYREVSSFLDGKIARSELESEIVTSTMQLAKRQMTWFKRDQAITWFDLDNGADAAVAAGVAIFEA